MSKHIIVMGSGQCGTTYLVQVLAALGFDTGGHLEILREMRKEIKEQGINFIWPHIIKGTGVLCHELKDKADLYGWEISDIFLCYRQVNSVVNSKIRKKKVKGYRDKSYEETRPVVTSQVLNTFGSALNQVSLFDCNVTLVKFPRSAYDTDYLYGCLTGLGVTKTQVGEAIRDAARLDKIRFGG